MRRAQPSQAQRQPSPAQPSQNGRSKKQNPPALPKMPKSNSKAKKTTAQPSPAQPKTSPFARAKAKPPPNPPKPPKTRQNPQNSGPKPYTISINPKPFTQIRNVVSKEETCPKRFSQKDSLINFSLLSKEAPPPLTQIRNVVSKEETCPKRFSQKDSLKTILSKRFSQKDSKRFSQNLLAPKPLTLNPSPKFEMWFQKRKPAQNVSLKKILSKISLFCQTRPRPPLTQIRNVVSKEETCPKRFSQKDSLKTILSKRFSQKDSPKTYWRPNP